MVFVVPDPQIEKVNGKTVVTLDKDEVETVLHWLDRVDTGWLNDQQYLYFIKFKEMLALTTKITSNYTVTPVSGNTMLDQLDRLEPPVAEEEYPSEGELALDAMMAESVKNEPPANG